MKKNLTQSKEKETIRSKSIKLNIDSNLENSKCIAFWWSNLKFKKKFLREPE